MLIPNARVHQAVAELALKASRVQMGLKKSYQIDSKLACIRHLVS